MDKGKFYSGLAIMVGLIILGVMIPTAVDKCMSYTRTVDVKGLCEKEVKADKVIWPISYKVMGEDLQNIYNQINQKNEILIAFLKEGGITDDEISVIKENAGKVSVEESVELTDGNEVEQNEVTEEDEWMSASDDIDEGNPKLDKIVAIGAIIAGIVIFALLILMWFIV